MDSAQAELFAEELRGRGGAAGWKLTDLLGYGKSAVVMRGIRGEDSAAVKIFHRGLIERYGLNAQLQRVEREKSLIGRSHDNLVKIIDGGQCPATGLIFVAMEFVQGVSLASALNRVPREHIPALTEQLARAAKQLEDWNIGHRDIKPGNIQLLPDMSALKLLDFGVMKPIGDNSATEQQPTRGFIGTHQYGPPEMIHGREEDTVDGWRAITFYQIGAVMHDLILRVELFAEAAARTPAELIAAIDSDEVVVSAEDMDLAICNLASRCLLKAPQDRLRLVSWQDFFFSELTTESSDRGERIAALTRRAGLGLALAKDPLEQSEERRLRTTKGEALVRALREGYDKALVEFSGLLPPRTTTHAYQARPLPALTSIFVADDVKGFKEPFHVQLAFEQADESRVVKICGRAGRGIEVNELGWRDLGDHLDSLQNIEEVLSGWITSLVEELLNRKV
jgi:serine/threonine protein kinase